MTEPPLHLNGINGATGEYLSPPLSSAEMTQLALGETRDTAHLQELRRVRARRAARPQDALLRPKEGVDPLKLNEAGWGVIFAAGDPQVAAIREALAPLLALRRSQAGDRYREYWNETGYRPGESKLDFLSRFGVAPGAVDPAKIPYYLLLVGDPEIMPFRFQYQLDVQFAVGRLHFDAIDEYAAYAASVVAAETGKVALPRRAVFFGPRSPSDDATQQSSTELVAPLAAWSEARQWQTELVPPAEAKRERLAQLLAADAPALLFTASHGMAFPAGDPRQAGHQGALLCSDWPGPIDWQKAIPPEFYLSADDITADAQLHGMIAFHFACFGAGTPRLDDFEHLKAGPAARLAEHSFVARLPRRMLAHPRGGALAVIGHVDQAWGYSFSWEGAGQQTLTFENLLQRLMEGHPVGSAMEYFNERYAELSAELTALLQEARRGSATVQTQLAGIWTANNDARSYIILGDPAVRLPVGDSTEAVRLQPVDAIPDAQRLATPSVEAAPAQPPPTEADSAESSVASKTTPEGDAMLQEPVAEAPAPNRANVSFLPPPEAPPAWREQDPELYEAWRKHVISGYQRNNEMFRRILNAFMLPYQITLFMYSLMFLVGIGLFITAAIMSITSGNMIYAAAFGGLGTVAFLGYFVSRPLQALEQNLQFITWLGIIYNTYWTRISEARAATTVLQDIDAASQQAVADLERMIARHDELAGKRPNAQ